MLLGLPRQVWRCRRTVFLLVSSLSWSKTRALSTTTTIPKYQYNSCSSPRFDDFSEKLIGEWFWQDFETENTIQSGNVQEVMRSCGGAVQGIREVPSVLAASAASQSSTKEEGYYLNRANDGFTYFDKDGSYSCGPVKIDTEDGKGDSSAWISSLTFGKTRLILTKNEEHCCECLKVHKKSVSGKPTINSAEEVLSTIPDRVVWDEIVRCRMPSTSQPWTTQRLKWERYSNSEETKIVTDETTESISKLHGWMLEVVASGYPSLATACALESSNILWSAGGVCGDTGFVKSIIREVSSADGSLKSVAWLRGRSTGSVF